MVSLEQIGILDFKSYNLKGKLFEREEDFKVQEIEEDGTVLNLERKEKREINIKNKKREENPPNLFLNVRFFSCCC